MQSFFASDLLKRMIVNIPVGWQAGGDEDAMDHNLLTCEEAAAYLRLHPRTVGRLLKAGHLPGVKVGCQRRLHKTDLDAYRAASARHRPRPGARPRRRGNAASPAFKRSPEVAERVAIHVGVRCPGRPMSR